MRRTLLTNANIYTQNPAQPRTHALLLLGDRILALGDQAVQAAEDSFPPLERFDLEGRTIIPGLTDAHLHLEYYAQGLQKVDCETPTRQECLERVAEHARNTPPGAWILGHGWNQNNWSESFGAAADLDTVAPQHPVYLTAKSLHAGWANSLALRLAGITENTPDPPDGQVGRDDRGRPDGILYEEAMQLVARHLPEPTVAQVAEAIRQAQPGLWQMGLTGVHDFDRRRCFSALQLLHQRGQLGLRVLKSIPLEDLAHAAALGLHSGFGDDRLRIGQVKVFADGALGPQTAAMLQPYEGQPANRGMLFLDAEELFEHGRTALETGLGMAVHAIGDRANHEVLEAFTQLRQYEREHFPQRPPQRLRIEHVQLLHTADAGRLAALGVIASMQPSHAPSDMQMADHHWGKRTALAYALRTQLTHGAMLALGSDAPVESPNPFWGLHAAVTRQRLDGSPGPDGWRPEQRLSLAEALWGFTGGPAYAAGMEDRLGRLSPGYLADLLVLEVDPFQIPPTDLSKIEPLATMVSGEWVFCTAL